MLKIINRVWITAILGALLFYFAVPGVSLADDNLVKIGVLAKRILIVDDNATNRYV